MADSITARASAHDLELVALAATGGRAAFGERHPPARDRRCAGCCAVWAPNLALVDDLAQDVAFLSAFEQISDFRGDGTFEASGVKRIAARLYVKRWRRRRSAAMPRPNWRAPNRRTAIGGESASADRIDLDGRLEDLHGPSSGCASPFATAAACPTPRRRRP